MDKRKLCNNIQIHADDCNMNCIHTLYNHEQIHVNDCNMDRIGDVISIHGI